MAYQSEKIEILVSSINIVDSFFESFDEMVFVNWHNKSILDSVSYLIFKHIPVGFFLVAKIIISISIFLQLNWITYDFSRASIFEIIYTSIFCQLNLKSQRDIKYGPCYSLFFVLMFSCLQNEMYFEARWLIKTMMQ